MPILDVDNMRELGILVVDESCDIIDVVERLFGHFKVTVDSVTGAHAALDRLRTGDYSTLIINRNLGDVEEFGLVNKAREQFPNLNIVIFACNTSLQLLSLIFDAKVTEISGIPAKSCGFGDMCMCILRNERGKTFLMEQVTEWIS